jgi:MarR family 2-MHQ and catechol resistance regulon transcriptional repressor
MPVDHVGIRKTEATHVFQALWKTYRALLTKADDSKRRLGLGDSDFRVLEALFNDGTLPVNVIGERVDLTTGSITTAINRLETRWLVVRKLHPQDRRLRMIELTAKGRRLIERACVQHALDLELLVRGLSSEERSLLIDLLGRLVAVTDANQAGAHARQ